MWSGWRAPSSVVTAAPQSPPCGAEAVVPERGHELDPQVGDLRGAEAGFGRRGREPVAGERRRYERERVGGVAAVARRVA